MWKKKSIFWDLPYWKDLEVRSAIDMMHVTKNLCVKFKDSELAKERSRINKQNAQKNDKFHKLGPGGYAVAMPKWDKSEKEMEDACVTPVTKSWPPKCRTWFYVHGGSSTRKQAK